VYSLYLPSEGMSPYRGAMGKKIELMYAVLRVAKLKSAGNLGSLNDHLLRRRDTPNADPKRTHLNQQLVGTDDLNRDVTKRIQEIGCKTKKDSVLALEYVMTASADFFKEKGKLEPFDNLCYDWLERKHGAHNIVSWHLHLDEQTPHIHAVVVPEKDGKLNAKAFTGGRQAMSDMQTSFAKAVEELGLERGRVDGRSKHTTLKEFYSLVNEAVQDPMVEPLKIEKPSATDLFNLTKWTEDQNRKLAEETEKVRRKVQKEAIKPNLIAVRDTLEAKAGKFKDSDLKRIREEKTRDFQNLESRNRFLEAKVKEVGRENEQLKVKLAKYEPTQNRGMKM